MIIVKGKQAINTSRARDGYNTKKRTRRNVLVFPGIGRDFAIDEEDFLVIGGMLSRLGAQSYEIKARVREIAKIRESDGERRVYALDPYWMENLLQLPEGIGDLVGLEKLDLSVPKITSLPPCIGRLRNLKYLFLSRNLVELPEEIGELVSLNKLDLSESKIASLPPSIGKLKNLKYIDLSYTDNLLELPDEIGDLTSLTKLDLSESNIATLPPSIGKLSNLEYLDLSWTNNLQEIPTEVGDLTSLNILSLRRSGVASLPESIERLTDLMYLNLYGTRIPNPEDTERKLAFELACKRSRSRMGLALAKKEPSTGPTPKLWPFMLKNALRTFDMHTNPYRYKYFCGSTEYRFQQEDAMYQLLLDGRESFIGVLMTRNSNSQ